MVFHGLAAANEGTASDLVSVILYCQPGIVLMIPGKGRPVSMFGWPAARRMVVV